MVGDILWVLLGILVVTFLAVLLVFTAPRPKAWVLMRQQQRRR
jgi:hypothetical protein